MPGETKEGNNTDTFKARDKNRAQHIQGLSPSPDPISAVYISPVLAAIQGGLNLSRIELYSIMFIVLSAEAILPQSIIQFIACNHVTLLAESCVVLTATRQKFIILVQWVGPSMAVFSGLSLLDTATSNIVSCSVSTRKVTLSTVSLLHFTLPCSLTHSFSFTISARIFHASLREIFPIV